MTKTIVQCDFDGTITEKDVSFLILDAYTNGDWHKHWGKYQSGQITVGEFNTRAFALVKADERSLLDYIAGKVNIRPGFEEMLACCREKGFEFVIVSNGLDFYIKAILEGLGLSGIDVFAARTSFDAGGMDIRYIGPDGDRVDDDFKGAYNRLYRERGYRVVYIGNGGSDLPPARQSQHIFATGDLLEKCRSEGLECTPFNDLNDVTRGLELI